MHWFLHHLNLILAITLLLALTIHSLRTLTLTPLHPHTLMRTSSQRSINSLRLPDHIRRNAPDYLPGVSLGIQTESHGKIFFRLPTLRSSSRFCLDTFSSIRRAVCPQGMVCGYIMRSRRWFYPILGSLRCILTIRVDNSCSLNNR